MIIMAAAIGVILIMKLFPETPAARLLHFHLVEKPAAWTRQHVIYAALLVGLAFAGGEFVMLAGGADLAMLMAWDMALAFDVFVAAWTAATMSRLSTIRGYAAAKWQAIRGRARPRARRSRRSGLRATRADNDDEPAPMRRAA